MGLGFAQRTNWGRRLNSAALKQLSMREAGLPEWLFAECYSVAGDLAETMTHLFPEPGVNAPKGSLSEWMQAIEAQRGLPPEQQQAFVLEAWKRMPRSTRFVFNKLITGDSALEYQRDCWCRP